jgi:hypothetical protein
MPKAHLLIFRAVDTPEARPVLKAGGMPVFVDPEGVWPLCPISKRPMQFLAQFPHDTEMLDLGGEGRVLYCFMRTAVKTNIKDRNKTSACAVIIQEPSGEPTLMEQPGDAMWKPLPEAVLDRVETHNEPDDERVAMVASGLINTWDLGEEEEELVDEMMEAIELTWKIGGFPCWVDDAKTLESKNACSPLEFSIQLDTQLRLSETPKKATGLKPTQDWTPGDEYPALLRGPDFGGNGAAYVYLGRREDGFPYGKMLWQNYGFGLKD